MRVRLERYFIPLVAIAAFLALAPARALAQTDEIQVYDASIAEPGVLNLTFHSNFTPDGRETPSFPGALVPDKSWNGAFEWAYGAKPWLELGLYLPLYTVYAENRSAAINGGKIRLLFVRPHADQRKFFYGANFEFSYNSAHWDPHTYTSEIRPIVGLHLHPWDFIFNPILDNSWTGGVRSLDFAPSTRVAYHLNDKWAVAAEEYDDIGPLRSFYKSSDQFHEMWAVFDHSGSTAVEAGIGFGLTQGSDAVTLKLILSRDLHHFKR